MRKPVLNISQTILETDFCFAFCIIKDN